MNKNEINSPSVEVLQTFPSTNGVNHKIETKLSQNEIINTNSVPDKIDSIQKDLIIEVLFKGNRRNYFISNIGKPILPDDRVVVNSENGIDLGLVTFVGEDAARRQKSSFKPKNSCCEVLRIASEVDLNQYFANTAEETSVVRRSKELIDQLNLDMKVTESEWQLDKQRLTIFFTAPQRIDFRDLVKELARTFRTRIELRQISTREETKRIGGGVGACGLNLCCTSFLNDFNHITLDHARLQQLSTNVSKLSGYCGRLKCCLLFEYETYSEAFRGYPQLYSRIKTNDGLAKLVKVDIFKNISTIHIKETGKYVTLTYEELTTYMNEGKVIPPAKEDLDSFFGQHGVQTRRDMLGEEYIVE